MNNRNNNNPNLNNNNSSLLRRVFLNYQLWPGNNRFFCRGRIILGPDKRQFFISVLGLVFPTFLFCCITYPWLCYLLRKYYVLGLIIGIFMLLDLIVLYSSFFIASIIDPGIVPRSSDAPSLNIAKGENDIEKVIECDIGRLPPLIVDVTHNYEKIVPLRYCYTCKTYRPPRCTHCPRCDNCVERFDHHCPWLGTCVFHMAMVVIEHLDDIDSYKKVFAIILPQMVLDVVLMLYLIPPTFFVGSLLCLHMFLLMTNQTTYENIKRKRRQRRTFSPHKTLANCGDVFLRRQKRSKARILDPISKYSLKRELSHILRLIKDMERNKENTRMTSSVDGNSHLIGLDLIPGEEDNGENSGRNLLAVEKDENERKSTECLLKEKDEKGGVELDEIRLDEIILD